MVWSESQDRGKRLWAGPSSSWLKANVGKHSLPGKYHINLENHPEDRSKVPQIYADYFSGSLRLPKSPPYH